MELEISAEKLAELREALLALPRRFAEVEAVVYAEKCATLPHLSIQERLAQFSELYELAMTLRAGNGPIPALETRDIEETVAIRQIFAKIAGCRPRQ